MKTKAAALIGVHLAQYALWLASWVVLGRIANGGSASLVLWAALLLAVVPFRVAGTWLQGLISVDAGSFLKTRLLCGALNLNLEEIRRWGLGSFLSQALEAETVETLAVTGGIAGVLAAIEIVVAGFLLGRFAFVLALWCALSALLAAAFFIRYRRWTESRMAMTNDLIESMAGHRTRLAQQPPERWHEGEAEALAAYSDRSRRLDRLGALFLGAIPSGWLFVGVASLAPAIASGDLSFAQIAIPLGGAFLAWTAFRRLSRAMAEAAAAWTAWERIRPLWGTQSGSVCHSRQTTEGGTPIQLRDLSFSYSADAEPVLRECDLTIEQGDRVLLEGPSGGGKTTLVSILAGLRSPQSGELRVGGAIAAAPQFHENYIVTETLAFNLLMGRAWPPAPEDMREAEAVCLELGLGELLDRMPGRLLQMVGEGGWQLSHGERSRIYIARALLQGADLTILDESFAALDPDTLHLALDCVLKRSPTLLLAAHP
ncbi:MAG: ATP-binding cassette domain-containing protein [Bryobacteraceae bacterium]